MPITVDGASPPDVGVWNRAMDARATQNEAENLPSAAAAPGAPLAVSPDLLDTRLAPISTTALSGRPNIASGERPPANYQSRGDWLDTVVMPRESGGRPNIGWGQTDLTPWLAAGQTIHGFPDWPGKPGPAGNSTAAGLYQITKTNWKHYAPLLGINDFSPESQRKVAEAILRDQGPRAWAASEPGYKSGLRSLTGGGGGSLEAAMRPMQLGGGEAAEMPPSPSRAVASAPVANLQVQPQQPTTQAAPAAVARHPVAPLQPVPLTPAPNLYKGYQDALAAVLNGQRRGFGSIFG